MSELKADEVVEKPVLSHEDFIAKFTKGVTKPASKLRDSKRDLKQEVTIQKYQQRDKLVFNLSPVISLDARDNLLNQSAIDTLLAANRKAQNKHAY
jgi:hypothetical protein